MTLNTRKYWFLLMLTSWTFWGIASANEWSAQADGVMVYFGVVPAEVARASLTPHVGPARDAHGRSLDTGTEHHIVIALFDSQSGARIENAEVSATLIVSGKYTIGKRLEPMRINETVSYGNVFEISPTVENKIDIEIRLPGRERSVNVSFRYRDPHGSKR